MHLTRRDTAVLRELIRRTELRQALESGFETIAGDRRFCVRRLDVVHHVAEAIGVRVINNDLFADIQREASGLGWEPIRNGGRSLFRCVKRRGFDFDKALAASRSTRHDPRIGRAST